jgi:hypothetical protein
MRRTNCVVGMISPKCKIRDPPAVTGLPEGQIQRCISGPSSSGSDSGSGSNSNSCTLTVLFPFFIRSSRCYELGRMVLRRSGGRGKEKRDLTNKKSKGRIQVQEVREGTSWVVFGGSIGLFRSY